MADGRASDAVKHLHLTVPWTVTPMLVPVPPGDPRSWPIWSLRSGYREAGIRTPRMPGHTTDRTSQVLSISAELRGDHLCEAMRRSEMALLAEFN